MKLPDKIIKRDGKTEKFDPKKITIALHKAMSAIGEPNWKLAEELTNKILRVIARRFENQIPDVEKIQDIVEDIIIAENLPELAKEYITYRRKRAELRELNKMFGDMEIIEGYLKETDWMVKENSNMSFSLQGLNFHISSKLISRYWLKKIYPAKISSLHTEGDFHIHDLGLLGPYCVGWDLEDLLRIGFKGVRGKIESKPAKRFRSALGQIVNYFYTLQGESAGAQAFSNFDTYLAPFIRYEKLNKEDVKQAMQEFLYNMNVPTRVGFQTPFTNITLDLTVPKILADQPAIWNGKIMEESYSDFQDEMDIFNEIFIEVMTEGDAKGRVFSFPIPTYNITKEFDWDNPVVDKLMEMTSKYGIPYFSNFVNSDMDPSDARSMCCRLRLDNRELRKRGGGLFGANPLTGSIGVVTINMPRLGYLSKDESEFFDRLGYLMDKAKESLLLKRKIIESYTKQGLYPYSKFYLRAVYEKEKEYWKNHFSTIGLNGMNEALLNLLGVSIADKEGIKFAEKTLEYMKDRLLEYQAETNDMFNLEATPAEGTAYRLALLDKRKYPDIIVANEEAYKKGQAPYYTNSTQLPVGHTSDLFEALDLQDSLQTKYTGGTVFHGFLGERIDDISTTKKIIKTIAYNYRLPYYTLSPTFSICPVHGYIPGEHKYCPYEHSEEELAKYGVEVIE